VVYIGSDNGTVYALHAAADPGHQVIWSAPIGGPMSWSSPAVSSDGSTVYIGSSNGDLYALRTAPKPSQRVAWHVFTGGPIRSGPVVADNVIYVACQSDQSLGEPGGVYAVKGDGTLFWRYQQAGWVDSNPTLTVAGGVVYFGSHAGVLYALDANTSAVLRQYPVVTGGLRADARPAVVGSVVYIGTDDGLYALQPSGASFSVRRHYSQAATVVSGPAVVDDVIYLGTGADPDGSDAGAADNTVYALNITTGQVRWSHRTGAQIFSSPVVSGSIVYIGSEDGNIYAFNTGS
jgi:eukaryotic-like serine/threonine-protein kinase